MQVRSRREVEEVNPCDPYQEDVERILHAKAYARYADKTQVVYLFPHDHITYRGLHVQLVSSLARLIGKNLGFSLELIEAISLGHDIGHPPFGHEGEGYLNELSQEMGAGAFSHARQSCRVVSDIEPLNLTLATLDGFLCHDGGMRDAIVDLKEGKSWKDHDAEMATRLEEPDSNLQPATAEAAIVKLADTASYLERDLTDAITLKIVNENQVPGSLFRNGKREISHAVARDIVTMYKTTGKIGFSEDVEQALKEIRNFSSERIYVNDTLKTESKKIRTAYSLLFTHLLRDFKLLSKQSLLWKHFLHDKRESYIDSNTSAQHVVDYIAGMTDGYFLRLFQELFVPQTIEVPHVLPFS